MTPHTTPRRKRAKTAESKAHDRLVYLEMAGYYGLIGAAGVSALFLR